MDKFLALGPAATAAGRLRAQSNQLDRMIDSARRGADVDPHTLAVEMMAGLKALVKELPRAA